MRLAAIATRLVRCSSHNITWFLALLAATKNKELNGASRWE